MELKSHVAPSRLAKELLLDLFLSVLAGVTRGVDAPDLMELASVLSYAESTTDCLLLFSVTGLVCLLVAALTVPVLFVAV